MKKTIEVAGHKSDWYEKGIFVLRDSTTTKIPDDLVSYAEDLLEKKLKTGEYKNNSINVEKYTLFNGKASDKKKVTNWNWIDDFFGISLGILGIAIIFYFLV